MKCSEPGCNRQISREPAKRINHYARYHQNKVVGMGLRIAADPFRFGQALGDYVKANAPQFLNTLCKGLK